MKDAGGSDFDTLHALLTRRHSCRGFLPDPVPEETLERIVATAGRAPSWCNAQPWHVTVTRPAATDRLRAALLAHVETAVPAPDLKFPTRYTGVYKERRSVCGWQLYGAVGVERGDREAAAGQSRENFRFFGAPHVAILTSPADLGPYGVLDCGGFVTAFTLAAEALGVASIPQAAIAAYAPFLRNWFSLPVDRIVVCGIAFGYEDTAHPANSYRTRRAPLPEILDWQE